GRLLHRASARQPRVPRPCRAHGRSRGSRGPRLRARADERSPALREALLPLPEPLRRPRALLPDGGVARAAAPREGGPPGEPLGAARARQAERPRLSPARLPAPRAKPALPPGALPQRDRADRSQARRVLRRRARLGAARRHAPRPRVGPRRGVRRPRALRPRRIGVADAPPRAALHPSPRLSAAR